MTDILLLIVAKGLVFALAGICVRIQLALWRGFDLIVAASVLVGAEIFVFTARHLDASAPLVAPMAAVLSSIALVVLWNSVLARTLFRSAETAGARLIVFSLGVSTAVTGLVGLVRGPGLPLPPHSPMLRPVLYATALGLFALGIAAVWARGRTGFALHLISQNRQFAQELGVRIAAVALPSSLVVGLSAGAIGSSLAATVGSTPEIGLQAFLYGAAAALLFEARSIKGPMLGGLLLGTASVALQLFLAPALAESVLFAAVIVAIVFRGSARTLQGVR